MGALLALGLFACGKKPVPSDDVAGSTKVSAAATTATTAAGAKTTEITLLVTADEDGFLLPADVPSRGGAAETMGKWVRDEGHCAPGGACSDAGTLVLSTGDHSSGPAISSYFAGQSTAQVMAQMGFAASALGNHELDSGAEGFAAFQKTSAIKHLAANATKKSPTAALDLPGTAIFERRGVKVGVVGLASVTTARASMAGPFEGIGFSAYETALAEAVPRVWQEGADAVVVIAHECPEVIGPVVEKHPEWHVSLVAGAHCKRDVLQTSGPVKVASCGRHFESYLRAKLQIDREKPRGERVVSALASRVDVTGSAPDPKTKEIVDGWKKKLDAQLGETIGFTKKGFDKDSPELAHLALSAIRSTLKVDVALANRRGFRGGLASGPITRAAIYGALPYENALVVIKVPGEALAKQLENPLAVFDGITGGAKDGFKDASGKALDPKKTYAVATLDYLYFGGDGFQLEALDPAPEETGMVWQTPVIDFLKAHKTTDSSPAEDLARSTNRAR